MRKWSTYTSPVTFRLFSLHIFKKFYFYISSFAYIKVRYLIWVEYIIRWKLLKVRQQKRLTSNRCTNCVIKREQDGRNINVYFYKHDVFVKVCRRVSKQRLQEKYDNLKASHESFVLHNKYTTDSRSCRLCILNIRH